MIKITVSSSLVLPGAALNTLATSAVLLGVGDVHTTSDGGNVIYQVPQPTDMLYSLLTPSSVAGIVSSYGGSIEGYVVYVRMTKSYADTTDVPSYVPGATYTDENDNTITRKWSELLPVGTVTISGSDFVTKEGTDGQTYWDGSIIAQLVALAATTVDMDILTPAQYRAWMPSEED